MQRFPVWLKVLIPVVLLLVVIAAALYTIATGELPPHAHVEAIQVRYGEPLAALREMAKTVPLVSCPGEEPEPGAMLEEVEDLRAWQARAEEQESLFADPAILGAEVVRFCPDGSTRSVGISSVLGKEYQEPGMPLSRALMETPSEWPAVSLWYDQARRTVRYEDRPETAGDGDGEKGFRLYLDLERLAESDVASGRGRTDPGGEDPQARP